jgi:hypothetical protein
VLDDIDYDSAKEMVAEQGWLTRLLLGRKAQLSISKRS